MRRITFRVFIVILTFTIGVAAVSFWFYYRLPEVQELEAPPPPNFVEFGRSSLNVVSDVPIPFCNLVNSPEIYRDQMVRVSGRIAGYHHQHLYHRSCVNEQTQTWATFASGEERIRLLQSACDLQPSKCENGITIADIIAVGRFEVRDERSERHGFEDSRLSDSHPFRDRFRFIIMEVERVEAVSEGER
jgi:hypothetical protein